MKSTLSSGAKLRPEQRGDEIFELRGENGRLKNQVKCMEIEIEKKQEEIAARNANLQAIQRLPFCSFQSTFNLLRLIFSSNIKNQMMNSTFFKDLNPIRISNKRFSLHSRNISNNEH